MFETNNQFLYRNISSNHQGFRLFQLTDPNRVPVSPHASDVASSIPLIVREATKALLEAAVAPLGAVIDGPTSRPPVLVVSLA